MSTKRSGLSLIEVIIAIGLVSLLFGGIYASYVSIIDVVTNSGVRTEAATVVANQIEIIRNLAYDQVGTQGGIPSGVLSQVQTVTSTNGLTFTLNTYIRNIDDPFDGTLGGSPNDTAPNDYKLVELSVRCSSCARSVPLIMTTTVAPKNLESGSNDGSLFVNVLDASGVGVLTATIRITNASVTPSIDLTDTTNASGVLQLVGAPTSTQGYVITVTKLGYSSERTYAVGDPSNPTPSSQYTHASVVAQTLSSKTFFIDRLSTTTFKTIDPFCRAVADRPFSLEGQKTIGPNVLKFSSSSATDSNGEKVWGGLEWDIYTVNLSGSGYDVLGTMPLSTTFALNPNTVTDFTFVLTPTDPNSLRILVQNSSTGAGIPSSTIVLTQSGFSETKVTGRWIVSETNWSGNNFETQNGDIDPDSVPGSLRLVAGGGGYSTTTTGWLTSNALDIGSSTGSFHALRWNPESQPGGTTVKFQLASNNDNATWNFTGPDGTSNTYYTTSGETINTEHTNHRYIKYRVYMSTTDSGATPTLTDIHIDFSSGCLPPYQVLFQDLSSGSYTASVSAPGYGVTSTSISVSSGANETTIAL
ncbi:MAG: prepilin-type N-terminal cleavage/methylation domain-containing protein [Patescibacteria group bacterium]